MVPPVLQVPPVVPPVPPFPGPRLPPAEVGQVLHPPADGVQVGGADPVSLQVLVCVLCGSLVPVHSETCLICEEPIQLRPPAGATLQVSGSGSGFLGQGLGFWVRVWVSGSGFLGQGSGFLGLGFWVRVTCGPPVVHLWSTCSPPLVHL